MIWNTFWQHGQCSPGATAKAIIEVLGKHRVPAIINTSSGGLLHQEETPSHVHFLNNTPYGWIFPAKNEWRGIG